MANTKLPSSLCSVPSEGAPESPSRPLPPSGTSTSSASPLTAPSSDPTIAHTVNGSRRPGDDPHARQRLLEQAEHLGHLGGWEWDAATGTTHWTDEIYRIHGIAPHELPAPPPHDQLIPKHYPPDCREQVLAAYLACTSQGRPFDLEVPFINAQGRRLWVRTGAKALRDGGGRITKVYGYLSDITDHRSITESLRESERRLTTLMANLPGAAYRCLIDANWTMEFLSPGILGLTGFPPEAFLNRGPKTYAEVIDPRDRQMVWDGILSAIRKAKPFTLEYRLVDSAGQVKWVWERGRLVTDPDHRQLLEGIILDITDYRLRVEGQLQQANLEKQLEKARKRKSLERMAGAVAHHVNNRLQVVLGLLEQARDWSKSPECSELITEALQATLDASKLGSTMRGCLGQTVGHSERLDVADLCRNLLPELQLNQPNHIHLEADLPSPGPAVLGDSIQIRHMIANLVANAFESPPATRVGLRVFIASPRSIAADLCMPDDWAPPAPPHVVIEVSDDGPGLKPEQFPQLFDPFYSTKFIGRGLGLPLTLGLTRSHGGGIFVGHNPAGGATLSVCLPLADHLPKT